MRGVLSRVGMMVAFLSMSALVGCGPIEEQIETPQPEDLRLVHAFSCPGSNNTICNAFGQFCCTEAGNPVCISTGWSCSGGIANCPNSGTGYYCQDERCIPERFSSCIRGW